MAFTAGGTYTWDGHPRGSNSGILAQLYTRYRVNGLKIRYSCRFVGLSGVSSVPLLQPEEISIIKQRQWICQHRVGGPDETATGSLGLNPYYMGETRWDKNSLVDNTEVQPKIHTLYINVRKIIGNNMYQRGSRDYIGHTDPGVTTGFSASDGPQLGPNLRFGVCQWSTIPFNIDPAVKCAFEYRATYTWDITYFSPTNPAYA